MRSPVDCPHRAVYAEADSGPDAIPLRVLAPGGSDLDGVTIRVHLGRCLACEQRVVSATAGPAGRALWLTLPAVLDLDPEAGRTGGDGGRWSR